MSGQPGAPVREMNVMLIVAALLLALGIATGLVGVYLVGGLGWTLLVGGAVIVALALVVLPT